MEGPQCVFPRAETIEHNGRPALKLGTSSLGLPDWTPAWRLPTGHLVLTAPIDLRIQFRIEFQARQLSNITCHGFPPLRSDISAEKREIPAAGMLLKISRAAWASWAGVWRAVIRKLRRGAESCREQLRTARRPERDSCSCKPCKSPAGTPVRVCTGKMPPSAAHPSS